MVTVVQLYATTWDVNVADGVDDVDYMRDMIQNMPESLPINWQTIARHLGRSAYVCAAKWYITPDYDDAKAHLDGSCENEIDELNTGKKNNAKSSKDGTDSGADNGNNSRRGKRWTAEEVPPLPLNMKCAYKHFTIKN
jgi:hypothetical protein